MEPVRQFPSLLSDRLHYRVAAPSYGAFFWQHEMLQLQTLHQSCFTLLGAKKNAHPSSTRRMGASSPTQFLGSVAARRTVGATPPRSRGFASHPCEWFAFVTLSRSLPSIFCASGDCLSYIENYLILLRFPPRSLMASADSHQDTNTRTTICRPLPYEQRAPLT